MSANLPAAAPEPVPEKTILVVDDEPGVREMVGRVLASEGYRVRTAANGREALSIVVEQPVDLVLLDLNMPEESGWDIFHVLNRNNPSLPIIIITAMPGQLFTALGNGVGALMEKPLDYPLLLRTLHTLLTKPAGHQTSFQYAPSKRNENETPPGK